MAIEIKSETFDELVLNSEVPVMVDFWAPWCGPCRVLGPIVESLSEDNDDNGVRIGKFNVDEGTEMAAKYGIRGIPCVLFFKNGEEVSGTRITGVRGKEDYQKVLDALK